MVVSDKLPLIGVCNFIGEWQHCFHGFQCHCTAFLHKDNIHIIPIPPDQAFPDSLSFHLHNITPYIHLFENDIYRTIKLFLVNKTNRCTEFQF